MRFKLLDTKPTAGTTVSVFESLIFLLRLRKKTPRTKLPYLFYITLNMRSIFLSITLLLILLSTLAGQRSSTLQLPDIQLFADQHTRGDEDLYGLGTWQISATAHQLGDSVCISLTIKFCEDVHDFTTMKGARIVMVALPEGVNTSETLLMDQSFSDVRGPNIGARGFQNFQGNGMIEEVIICTDTFGTDTGKVGGTIRFKPIRLSSSQPTAVLEKKLLPVFWQ